MLEPLINKGTILFCAFFIVGFSLVTSGFAFYNCYRECTLYYPTMKAYCQSICMDFGFGTGLLALILLGVALVVLVGGNYLVEKVVEYAGKKAHRP